MGYGTQTCDGSGLLASCFKILLNKTKNMAIQEIYSSMYLYYKRSDVM